MLIDKQKINQLYLRFFNNCFGKIIIVAKTTLQYQLKVMCRKIVSMKKMDTGSFTTTNTKLSAE
jgi:ABC-type transport system involved in Fe-S cluster assembly fused permease/ATPase subunit